MKIEMARGVRDFSPEEKILREEIVNNIKNVFELYGYSPLETPSIEKYEVLSAKFAAGQESDALKETFKLTDQGKRKLGLRFDLTVPLARYIAVNPNIRMPFKRYEIGRVFRDGPIKLGRYREFWQCDVDIVGCNSMKADAECINLAVDVFKNLKMDIFIEVNNRKIIFGILDAFKIPDSKKEAVIVAIDKLGKIGIEEVKKELKEKTKNADELIEMFKKNDLNEIRKIMKNKEGFEGIHEIEELFEYILDKDKVKLNLALARGLSYYTGTVFEGFLKNSEIKSSVCGGGRYDKMIGLYAGNNKEYGAVGISFGLEPITEAFRLKGKFEKKTVASVFIIPIQAFKQALPVAQKLREHGIKVDMDLMERGVSKNLDYANSMKIPYVIFIGEHELKENKVKLRNMSSGKEELLSVEEAIKKLS